MTDTLKPVFNALDAIDGAVIGSENFAELTTLHIGGSPLATVHCRTTDAVVEVVNLLDEHEVPLLIVGGGSNLVIADGEVPVVAVVLECDAVHVDMGSGKLRAEAGAVWDEVVSICVEAGLGGIECLSGIPGSAGATPVQNVGAYGAEIADVLTRVELYDRVSGERSWVSAESLDLAYRYSNLKFTARAVVLAIELQLSTDGMSVPLRFGELARTLGLGDSADVSDMRMPVAQVREAVLGLRNAKGMVYNAQDHDTWSAGSFFTNPIVPIDVAEAVRLKAASIRGEEDAVRMPCFPAGEGLNKLSAAWLIDRAGFDKGHLATGRDGRAGLSTKHTLALTNRGNATSDDIVALAREVRAGVQDVFGVVLEPEPVWVGVSIDG